MSVFYNGRLLISPVVASRIDDSAMRNRNLTVGNILAIVGQCDGGQPATALRFGDPSDARTVLRSGDLMTAVERAFDPSPQLNAPSTVIAVRVNPATQAALTLKDAGAANVIDLKSTDYGLHTNQIKVKVETGTNKGKKLTTTFGTDFYVQDDVYRDAFSIQYTGGQATAIMTVNNTTVTLEAPTGTPVATIDLNTYSTIRQLVDFINTVADFTSAVLDGNDNKPALNGLDAVTAQDVKSASYTAVANLQAAIDWFNGVGEGFIDATRVAAGTLPPANIADTYLSGATNGVVTNNEWQAGFDALKVEDVQWVVPLSSDPSIQVMAETHASFMSDVSRMERRALAGGASAEGTAVALANAKALNSDRISIVSPGYYDYDAAGKLTLYPTYMSAALVAAGFAGSDPGTPLTNKALSVRGLETKYKNPTDTDVLIEGGVLALEDTPQGYKVVKSITTWLVNDNYNRVEVSTGFATDFTARNVREALQDLIGRKGSPITLIEAKSRTDTALRELSRPEPAGPGVLVGDETNPPFKNIRVSLVGDVLRVEFEASPVIPVNYVLTSIHIVPFQGSIAA